MYVRSESDNVFVCRTTYSRLLKVQWNKSSEDRWSGRIRYSQAARYWPRIFLQDVICVVALEIPVTLPARFAMNGYIFDMSPIPQTTAVWLRKWLFYRVFSANKDLTEKWCRMGETAFML